MDILPGLKTCRKGLHHYSSDLKRCPECRKENSRRWNKQNPERKKENSKRWREQNLERSREIDRRWKSKNVEKGRENARKWYKQNTDQTKEKRQIRREKTVEHDRRMARDWKKNNPDKVNALLAKRYAAKKQAIAPWADLEAIQQIYTDAANLTRSTGIPHHVDHVYPLQSDYMCGLHVETNLQILTQTENSSKGNRTWPGQLDCQRLAPHLNGFDIKEVEGD